jgi:uncharacterized protein YggE
MTVDENLSKVAAVTDAVMQVAGNASVSVQFNLKNRAPVEDRAKIEAIANARHQADILAAAEGWKIDTAITSSTTLAAGNLIPDFGILGVLQPQDRQIPVTQQVVVQYGLQ